MMDKSSESSITKHHSYTISITSILLIITPIMLVILLVTIIILIVLLHRHKLKKLDIFSPNDGSNIDSSGCEFVDHTIINCSESPGGTSRLIIQCRVKGVQVFTYQELEMATDSFIEANVLGHGGYGKVYRGVLSDGTLAAIKLVHRDGKQSERTFKMEALPRLTHREKVMEMVDPTIKGQYSPKDMIQIAAVAAVCVQAEPDYRPLMTDVVQSLIPLVKSISSNPLATSGFLANMVGPSSERHSFS